MAAATADCRVISALFAVVWCALFSCWTIIVRCSLCAGEYVEVGAGGDLLWCCDSTNHGILARARGASVTFALTAGLALSPHHERIPSGGNQIVAQTYNLVIFVAMVAENFLGELAHVAGYRELAELHVAAHFLDRGLSVKTAAVVLGVRGQHGCPEALVDFGELLPRALLMLQPVMGPCDRDTEALAHVGESFHVIKRLRAFHAEAVDDIKFFSVVRPRAQGRRERVSIAEVDADDPPGP